MEEIMDITSKMILSILVLVALTVINRHDYTCRMYGKLCDVIDDIMDALNVVIKIIIFAIYLLIPFVLIWLI